MPRHIRILSDLVCLIALFAACAPAEQQTTTESAAGEAPVTTPDLVGVASNLTAAGMITPGDRVLIFGNVRDYELLENIAVETMKLGGNPLIAVGREKLTRRSYDEVPAAFDTLPPTLGIALANAFDVQLSVDAGESDTALAGISADRLAARAKAGEPAVAAGYKRIIRSVNLGNGLYPTAQTAERLGITQAELTAMFWRAAAVPVASIRAAGEGVRAAIASAPQITITAPNGTNLTVTLDAAHSMVSDGALTAEKLKGGPAAAVTWLPAGEVLVPAKMGTAEGTLVADRYFFQGSEIRGLTLAFTKGKLTSMTATSGLEKLKALYDAAVGGKDAFGYIDIGVNPEAKVPTNTGLIVWMAPGAVTVGVGDNRGWGGTNASTFGLAMPLSGATLVAGGKTLIENGTLK